MNANNYRSYQLPFRKKNIGRLNRKRKRFTSSFYEDSSDANENDQRNHKLCIIFLAHKGIWHYDIWTQWNLKNVDMYVHKDQDGFEFVSQQAYSDLFPKGVYRIGDHLNAESYIPVERGRLSHIKAILNTLKFAFKQDVGYSHYMILSGDSLPVFSCSDFLKSLNTDKSVIAYEKHKSEFITHNMEMILCKNHAEIIINSLIPDVFEKNLYKADDERIAAQNTQFEVLEEVPPMMDEYVIGSYLYNVIDHDQIINKAFAGWIAKDNKKETLRSLVIHDNQKIQIEPDEYLIAPNSEDGLEHIILSHPGTLWKQVDATEGYNFNDTEKIIYDQIDFDQFSSDQILKIHEPYNSSGLNATSIVKSGEFYFKLVQNTYTSLSLANALLYKIEPWDRFLVMRKINPSFRRFKNQILNLITNKPVLPLASSCTSLVQ